MTKIRRAAMRRLGIVAALAMMSTAASATDGYFQMGYGPRQNAIGGAGVADSRDAMSMALNPAGIAGMGEQFQLGAAAFMPYRGYEGTGTFFIAPGNVDSDLNLFVVPNVAYSRPIDADSSFGFVLYGNGGMNTTYPNVANPNCGGGSGIFCGGSAGVDLMQAFLSGVYARDFGPLKVGVAPTFVVQRFKAEGLAAFSPGSADPAHLTNNGYDYSYGGGLRGGAEMEVMPGMRLGVAAQTKMYMTKFDKYAGLYAGEGSFDVPAQVTAGLAVDVTPDVTMMFDYQHIFYGDVDSIANSSTNAALFGSSGGPGFGWHDVDVFKAGAEWRVDDQWTVRAGYAYTSDPIHSSDVTINILAPGVVQHHITGGFSYKATEHSTFEFAGMYAPEIKVSGAETTPGGPTPGKIEINMHQFQVLGGWTYEF